MTETRVVPSRIGTDIVKSIFMNVKTRRIDIREIRIDSGALVGADDGSDTLFAISNIVINGAVVGVNGLDTGSLNDDNWYSIWLIKMPNGSVGGLVSLDFTNPVMPSG